MARKIMDNIILAILGGIGGAGGFTGLAFLFNAWRESRRKDKEQDSQLLQIAAKFNIEATNNATKLFSDIADRLDAENKDLRERVISLELAKQEGDRARQERDIQIEGLKQGQDKMVKEVQTLREDNQKKDDVIQTQGKRIGELEKENGELKGRQEHLEEKIQRLVKTITDGGLSLPDGWENGG